MTSLVKTDITRPVIVLCLLAFFAMGNANLKFFPIGNDEYNSLSHIQQPETGAIYSFEDTISSIRERSKQHSPLYFLLLNVWRTLAGADLFTLRLFSLYFGLLTVAAAYRIGSSYRGGQLGLTALLITTFLAYHLFYSHTARMYTLLPLAASWVIWSYWSIVSAADLVPRWRWLSLLASSVALLYLHYFGIMMLAAIGVYHLLFVRKDRRWWHVTLTMTLSGICFLPWLPVAIAGFTTRINLSDHRLPLLDSLLTFCLVFSNGLFFLPLATAALGAVNWRRLNQSERFLLLITGFTLLLTILANEFTPILVARRMRYMTLLTVPFCCSLAIGLRLVPGRKLVRITLLVLWLGSFVVFSRSDDLLHYANKLGQNLHKTAHYQDFIYESEHLPGHNELILSFHPDAPVIVTKTLRYYRAALSNYAHLAHISYDTSGELIIQSNLSTFATLDAIAENATGIWVIHDPQQTDLQALDVYADWFSQHYQSCGRYVDKTWSAIDYYLRLDVPCELIADSDPLTVRYDNGTELGNLIARQIADTYTAYLRWLQTIGEQYSFALQVFDRAENKVAQADRVISGEPLDIVEIDISELSAGDYTVKLIVYDFASGASQPGLFVNGGQRFEREVDVDRISIGE